MTRFTTDDTWLPTPASRAPTSRNYETPRVDASWADSRNTHMAVAVAIHAVSGDGGRTPEAIWESPTPNEWDHVTMAVFEYLLHGDFTPEPDGRYPWGEEAIAFTEGQFSPLPAEGDEPVCSSWPY